MIRICKIFLPFMILLMLFQADLDPKPAVKKNVRAKQADKKALKSPPLKKKPPDPELEWKDCGEYCLKEIFDNGVSIRIPPINGLVKNFAVRGEYLYLLVQNFNLITDAIFIIKRDSGMIQSIWGIGRHRAEAIACDGNSLVIISRSSKHFMRRLSLRGKGTDDIGLKSLPEGSIHGLAIVNGNLVFVMRSNEISGIYLFNPSSKTIKQIHSYRGSIQAIAFFQNNLIAYLNEFDAYWNHWLLIIDMKHGLKKKVSFVDTVPCGFASDEKSLYMLEKRESGAYVYPVALLTGRNMVLANPLIRRVEIDFPVISGNRNPYRADLWIPYPINRNFQNIRRVVVEPQPLEIVRDRFGNQWAHIRWEYENKNVTAVLKFDLQSSDVAYTIASDRPATHEKPPSVMSSSLSETHKFDTSNYIIKSHSTRIDMNGPYLSQILAIRRYIRSAVQYSDQNERWPMASEYLFRGRGDAYGHAISFAAIARFLGVPARAACGLVVDTASHATARSLVWNQVYFPDNGWVDVGSGGNDHIAYRSNRHFVAFEGNFDKADYTTAFAETDLLTACKWSSIDAGKEADITTGGIRIKVQDLKE